MFDRIKNLCKESNISVAELERKLGFTRSYLRKWDTITPSIDKVQKVADYFGCSLDYLYGNQKAASSEAGLSPDELEMLDIYKALKSDDRKRVKLLAKAIDKILGVDE